MGRGNWCPPEYGQYDSNVVERNWVYVDYLNLAEEEDEFLCNIAFEDFKTNLFSLLPKSFKRVENDWPNKYSSVFARNGLFDLILGDNESMISVCLISRVDSPAFAHSLVNKEADKLFDKLFDLYELYVRTSAWTIELYRPKWSIGINVFDYKNSFDRYTIEIPDKTYGNIIYAMSNHPRNPQGFSQFITEGLKPNKNWGEPIPFMSLNREVIFAIKDRL